jgi:hypothetical protein
MLDIVEGRTNLPGWKVESYKRLFREQGYVLPQDDNSAAQQWCLFYHDGVCAVASDMVDKAVKVDRVTCANCMASRYPCSINQTTLLAAESTLEDESSKKSLVLRYGDRIESDTPKLPCVYRGQTVDRVKCGCPGYPLGVRVKACQKFGVCSITSAEWERAIEKYRATELKCCERCPERTCT